MNKKIIQELTQQRELQLLKQKEEQENLIHSIFPPWLRRFSSKSKCRKYKTSHSDKASLCSLKMDQSSVLVLREYRLTPSFDTVSVAAILI